jgi:hypothetical protein
MKKMKQAALFIATFLTACAGPYDIARLEKHLPPSHLAAGQLKNALPYLYQQNLAAFEWPEGREGDTLYRDSVVFSWTALDAGEMLAGMYRGKAQQVKEPWQKNKQR